MTTNPTSKQRVEATDLNINIASRREQALFHWLMAVILFSKPVQQELAADAFVTLKQHGYDSPKKLKRAGWKKIIAALGEAHYVRYDESTATRLLDASHHLLQHYKGNVHNLIRDCKSAAGLRRRIQEFKGIGPKGAEIFLREVRPVYYS